MSDDDITIDLSSIDPIEYVWNESDISTDFVALEMGSVITGTTLVAPSVSANTITITKTGLAAGSNSYSISTGYEDMEERLSKLEKIIAEEAEVRRTHPAVQMAYDEYRLLYILAKKNPGDLLTDE